MGEKNLESISLNFYKLYVATMRSRRGVVAQCHRLNPVTLRIFPRPVWGRLHIFNIDC